MKEIIKNICYKLCDNLNGSCSKLKLTQTQLKIISEERQSLISELDKLNQKYSNCLTDNKSYELMFNDCNEELNVLKAVVKQYEIDNTDAELKYYWDNKYPQKTILYKGRSLPFSTNKIKVPVNVLITPTDPQIIQQLKDWGLYKSDLPLAERDIETLIPKIYKKIYYNFYRYKTDKQSWNFKEVWEMPFEMYAKSKYTDFDCDSYGILQSSFYIAAGIPAWRVRCVAGQCYNGEGHLTVYVYSVKEGRWHHLNCLVKDSKILTKNGYVNIQDIKKDDLVYDNDMVLRKVNNTFKINHKNKVKILTSGYSFYLESSKEHKFLCSDKEKDGHWFRKNNKLNFKLAKDIEIGDKLVIPINDNVQKLNLDKDLIWLFGHYLGNGNTSWRKRNNKKQCTGLRFINNINKIKINQKIKNLLSKYSKNKITTIIKNNICIINLYDKLLAEQFNYYCGKFTDKTISKELLFMEKDKQIEFLKGFIEADGCFSKHRNVDVICITQSEKHKNVIRGILFMLHRLRISYNTNSRWNYKATFEQKNKICNIQIRNLDYDTFKQSHMKNSVVKYIDNKCFVRVKKVLIEQCDETFYEIEVDKTHTYNVDNFACHNSTYGTGMLSYKSLSEYPTHTDAEKGNDKMGIKSVWFSFNNKFGWSKTVHRDKYDDIDVE